MAYEATITITEDTDLIWSFLEKGYEGDRSKFKAKKEGDKILIDVNADDAVAFRATINTLTKSLATFRKMSDV